MSKVSCINVDYTQSKILKWFRNMAWRSWLLPIPNWQRIYQRSPSNYKVWKQTSFSILTLTRTCIVWLKNNTISKLVIVIKSKDTLEVLERWNFNVEVNGENGLPMAENIPPAELVFLLLIGSWIDIDI